MSILPPVVGELKLKASEARAEIKKVAAETKDMAEKAETAGQKVAAGWHLSKHAVNIASGAIIGGAALVGKETISMAGDFQEGMTQLVTGAGVPEEAIGKISDGIMKLAPQMGQTTSQLTSGMYMIASAGYKGSDGLDVLKASAEGAKVGNADLGTVANALTSALNDYHMPATSAADVTSKLVATVANGKMHMQDLADAFKNAGPTAAALGINMNDLLGGIATMTSQGIDAADATTYMRFGMMALANPSAKAQAAMEGVGLSAKQVGDDLKSKGLSGTLNEITDAIGKKFPAGSAEYNAALADIVGGTRGMQMALTLTGQNAQTYAANIKAIGATTTETDGSVQGWNKTTEDTNFKLAQAKEMIETAGIKLGTVLLPYVSKAAAAFSDWLDKIQQNKGALQALGIAAASVLAVPVLGALIKVGEGIVKIGKGFFGLGKAMVTGVKGGIDLISKIPAGLRNIDAAGNAVISGVGKVGSAVGKVAVGFGNGVRAAAEWGASVTKNAAMSAVALARTTAAWVAQTAKVVLAKTAQLAVAAATKIAAAAQWLMNAAMSANPIGLIIAAIVLLVGGLILAYNKVGWFKDFVNAAFQIVQTVIAAVVNWVTGTAVPMFVNGWNMVAAGATWLYNNVIAPYFQLIQTAISVVVDFVTGVVVPGFESAFSAVGDAIHNAVQFFIDFQTTTANVVQSVISFIAGLPGQIMGIFAGAGSWLVNVGSQIIGGLISGITGAIGGAISAVQGAVGGIMDGIKGMLGIHSPSTVMAEQVGVPMAQGIAQGIVRASGRVTNALASVTDPSSMVLPGITPGVGAPMQQASLQSAQQPGGSWGRFGGQAPIVNVYVTTNADPHQIATEMAFQLQLQS